jgi:glycine/D-amino acid oxidase-like deaminating enzyme
MPLTEAHLTFIARDAFTGSQSFRIEQMGDNVWYLGGGSFHSFTFRPVLPRLIAARLGLNGGDDDGKEWESLMREESKKHADLFPTRCWE